ncbi:30S ribosomal protein S1 [Candidatus Cyrtobacter comes]|uniref:30S ribosomal protein S1 n=1 Tax=Candidatus Cyrtobacter comes TaxID=675776 RepID=A0ABU5L837_9RICK|nr:30S ribosomal protein S1 [Candidatus Cyrtobacter comes]MDZ5762289.1 30S ribosomal protein S1 [Candidatus Cyrtobacter comes]
MIEVEKLNSVPNEISEEFDRLFEQYVNSSKKEGQVVSGVVTNVNSACVTVDVGLKSDGIINVSKFMGNIPNIGDSVSVYIDKMEDWHGRMSLSLVKAKQEQEWTKFKGEFVVDGYVHGNIIGKVKGGFAVQLDDSSIVAFLPGSQVDIRPVKDINDLVGVSHRFKILKIDGDNGNVVISRRAIIEDERREAREERLANLKEGDIVEGVVKNITEYGAFVCFNGTDGLLHITDMSWSKISHPSEILSLGQSIKVKVIKYNPEASDRISLGIKQLQEDGWESLAQKYVVGNRFRGTVTSILDYGAFIELEKKVEGLVHKSEISWSFGEIHVRNVLKVGQEVEVVVIEVDVSKRRIGLSMKKCTDNPLDKFAKKYPVGTEVSCVVRSIVDFGIYVDVSEGEVIGEKVNILIPASEISWSKTPSQALKDYKPEDKVQCVITNIDTQRDRVSASMRQLGYDSMLKMMEGLVASGIVMCTVLATRSEGIEVSLPGDIRTFIKRGDLSKHRSDQRSERFSVGDKIEAKVISFDKNQMKVSLSIKALEVEEEKKAIAEYGSAASGASLGDILGGALRGIDRHQGEK